MVGSRLIRRRFPLDEPLPGPVEDYLAELAAALPRRSAASRDVLAEVADGLLESVEAHVVDGSDPAEAARSAVAEFGPARDLADGIVPEMTGTTAHRVGLALVATGPVVGLCWLTAFAVQAGTHWSEELPSVLAWLPGYAILMFVVVASAVIAAAGGRGPVVARLPIGPRRAAAAAIIAAVGCAALDTMLLTHLASVARSGGLPGALAIIPATLSLTRMGLAAAAARRCWELRSAVRAG